MNHRSSPTPRARRVVTAVAAGLLLALRPARAAPTPGFQLAARVPASTLAFVRVPSPRALAAAWADTAPARLLRADDVAPFVADVERAGAAFLARAARGEEAGCPPALAHALEQAAALEGDVQVALLGVDASTGPRWAAALDFGPRVAAFVEALRAFAAADRDGLRFAPTADGGAVSRSDGTPVAVFAVRGTTVVATNDPAQLEALAAPTPRASGSLADTGAFTSAGGAGADGALATAVVDPGALADQAPGLAPGTAGRRIADAFGLAGVVVAGYRLAVDGDDLVERVAVRAPGREARLTALVAGRPGARRRRGDAPPGAWLVVETGIAPAALLARLREVLSVADERLAGDLDAWLDAWKARTGDDLAVLLAPLGDDTCAWCGPSPQGGLVPDVGLALTVADAAAFDAAATRAAAGAVAAAVAEGRAAALRSVAFRGATLRFVDGERDPTRPAAGRTAWTVLGDACLVAPHVHGLRETVARHVAHEPSFAGRPDPAPPGAVATLEVDLPAALAFAWGTLAPWAQSVGRADLGAPFPPPALVPFRVPFARAPATRSVAPFLRPASLAVVPVPDGVRCEGRGPLPVLGAALVALAVGVLRPADGDGPGPLLVPTTADPAVADPEEATDVGLARTAAVLAEYAALFGGLPATLDDVVVRGRLLARVAPDGWRRPLLWQRAAGGRRGTLRSAGPDGRPGTDDDRTVEVEAPAK